jgi:D-glycero-D-manno-heptose 1,7-bisphosphate phosphatase
VTPVAFLDRDGTINRPAAPGEYIESWDEFRFLPRAPEAIALLRRSGMRAVVVTNQRGVALGKMTAAAVEDIHRRMTAELEARGAALDAVYYCPHAHDSCDCRKPKPGMLLQAARDLPDVDLAASVMIGDSESDMQAGAAAGCRLVMIGAGPPATPVEHVAASLWDAAVWLTR